MLGYNSTNQVDGVGCGGICTIVDNGLPIWLLNHALLEVVRFYGFD
jgi:hypothetical protein